MTRPDVTTAVQLTDPTAVIDRAHGVGGATAELVSGIRNGTIRLDVPDAEAWLDRFRELVRTVGSQATILAEDARWIFTDRSLGDSELSRQIMKKLADRTGNADGGLSAAIAEIATALDDIHRALHSSLVTHTEVDQASADRLTRLVEAAGDSRNGADG